MLLLFLLSGIPCDRKLKKHHFLRKTSTTPMSEKYTISTHSFGHGCVASHVDCGEWPPPPLPSPGFKTRETMRCWSQTSHAVITFPLSYGCWLTHCQFHSQFHSRRMTLVRMSSSYAWTMNHDNGASDVWASTTYWATSGGFIQAGHNRCIPPLNFYRLDVFLSFQCCI